MPVEKFFIKTKYKDTCNLKVHYVAHIMTLYLGHKIKIGAVGEIKITNLIDIIIVIIMYFLIKKQTSESW